MSRLIDVYLIDAFAVSLDHDLHVPGVADAGDGLLIAEQIAERKPNCPVIIHTSNSEKSRQMQGVLEAAGLNVRLAGAIGEQWVENDWVTEVIECKRIADAELA